MIWERWDSPRAPKGGQSGKESGGRSEPHGQVMGEVGEGWEWGEELKYI